MAEIVNLNKARKAQARQEAKAQATANRAKFGQDKASRIRAEKEASRAAKDHDGRKLD